MNLIIDNRERDLIDYWQKNDKIEIKTKNLDLGDIIIENNNKELLVIERKTIKDLAISIKDGRYKEQKERLIGYYVKNGIKVLYLLEGKIEDKGKIAGIPYSTIKSSIISTMLRDGIFVYCSRNLVDTFEFISRVFAKYQKNDIIPQNNDDSGDYLEKIKLRKKDNKNDADSMIFMLCQVPRMSISAAKCIREKYATIRDLILAYEESTDCEGLLADIRISDKRRLGKVASVKIWKYLCEK